MSREDAVTLEDIEGGRYIGWGAEATTSISGDTIVITDCHEGKPLEVPLKPPKPPKRIRLRRCEARLFVPGDTAMVGGTTFKCQLEVHPDDVSHREEGYVDSGSTGRRFTIAWTDLGFVSFRKREKAK